MIGISHAPSLINLLRVAAGDCLTFHLQNLLAPTRGGQGRNRSVKRNVVMDRTTAIAGSAVILGMALIGFGVWRTAPPTALNEVALPDTWSEQAPGRDGTSLGLDDVQFRVTDKASGQPLSGVAPGVRVIPGDTH
jgi:hypothetical protein